jgi:protoporphyrinogen oxidase
MSQALRSIIDKWDLMKQKSFYKAKDTSIGQICNLQFGKNVFTNLASDRVLISKIYKEFKKLT